MMILGLDIATTVGFAYGSGEGLPLVGHVKLPPADDGARGDTFLTFWTWLRRMLDDTGASVVIFEAPILPQPFIKAGRIVWPTSIATTTILQGLVAIVEMECARRERILCVQTSVTEVKKQLTGNGKAEKVDMVRAARKMGLTIAIHDEADGVGVWLVGVRYYAKQHLHQFDRMLWGRGAAK